METKVVKEKQNMTYLLWTRIRNSSGTAGTFLKAYDDTENGRIYYKMPGYNEMDGVTGHECVNEIIADRLLSILGIEHLHYQLINAELVIGDRNVDAYICASEDFKNRNESKIALDAYYYMNRNNGESMMDFCIRNGWEDYIYEMLVVDYLILNRDRHGANIEVLMDKKKKTVRLAPLFDHGLSLLFSCRSDDEVDAFDIMKDARIQCCVGSDSSYENLKLIPEGKSPKINELTEDSREIIFEGLDEILGEKLTDRIWQMIWERWKNYEDLCNS